MPITYRPAVRGASFFLLGLAGPSGSGKTLSALRIARGLAGGSDSDITFLDTESGRALHYACAEDEEPDAFHFRCSYGELTAPFTPAAYREAVLAAMKPRPPKVLVIDSASHEHEGEGGILEMAEAELHRMAGDDPKERDKWKFSSWNVPKREHHKFLNVLLQVRCHVILCFRAKDKIAAIKNAKGKTEFVSVGWTPICADRLEYEATALLVLPPNSKGMPDLGAERTKLQKQHEPIFPEGRQLDEKTGQMIARWCSGKPIKRGATPAASPPVNREADQPALLPEEASQPDGGPVSLTGPGAAYHEDAIAVHSSIRSAMLGAKLEYRRSVLERSSQGMKYLEEVAPGLAEDLHHLANVSDESP